MHIMTRVGDDVWKALGNSEDFVRGMHTVGYPLPTPTTADVPWPCNKTKYISHFPETREIWSYGSGYGGNALLGKKCHALRIASVKARDEGWMAEHMLILKLTNPEGKSKFMAAAFPSACGKTNLAMLNADHPRLEGRDHRRRHLLDEVRRGRAALRHQSRDRLLRRGARHFDRVQLQRHEDALRQLHLFQRRADRRRRRVVGADEHAAGAHRRLDAPLTGRRSRAARPRIPNARFTAPASQCPVIAPEWEDPKGVPIDAILFGGRRATVVPLVVEALNWLHGTFLGSIMASEKTAAAAGKIGDLRRDPMAMLPFCGYHMGDYFAHWLKMGEKGGAKMPKIFYVNWFRKNGDGKFMWPGYAENSRVLKWIFERCDGTAKAVDTRDRQAAGRRLARCQRAEDRARRPEGADQRRQGWLEGRAAADQGAFRHLRRQAPQGAQRGALRAREAAQLVASSY